MKLFCQDYLFTTSIAPENKQKPRGGGFHLPAGSEFSFWCALDVKSSSDSPLSGSLPFSWRTSPWLCTWGTTGRTSASHSPAPPTRAWPSTAGWWRRSGSQMYSLCTPKGPSFTTRPRTTSCCESSPMGTSSTAWGKGTAPWFLDAPWGFAVSFAPDVVMVTTKTAAADSAAPTADAEPRFQHLQYQMLCRTLQGTTLWAVTG